MNGSSSKAGAIILILFLLLFWGLPLIGIVWSIITDIIENIKNKAKSKHEAHIEEFVNTNSKLLKELQSLNARQSFYDLKASYPFTFDCYSKPDYERFDFHIQFCDLCYRKKKEFRELLQLAKENREKYDVYDKEYSQITSRIQSEGLRDEYQESETKKLTDQKLSPVCNPQITIIRQYITPKGRNHYRSSNSYLIDNIESAIKERQGEDEQKRLYKSHIERERALVTNRLRYQVMQRDHFRCQICGASQAEGVQLHVDHIKPVSKGGKTEMKNLRTLCDRCNSGKGDLYNEKGIN